MFRSNPITSFWTVTFSIYGSICIEPFQSVTSEAILKKKSNGPAFVYMNLVFYQLLTITVQRGQLSIQVYVMFIITNLIGPRTRKLMLDHLIGNNSPYFHNGFLGSYFRRSDCLKIYFWAVAFKPILTQQYYKNTSHFQTRVLNTIQHICCL